MAMRPWRRELGRRLRRGPPPRRRPQKDMCWRERPQAGIPPAMLTVAVAVLLAWGIVGLLETRLRPIVSASAQAQTQNIITAALEQAIVKDLGERNASYSDFISIQRDRTGTITSLTTNMAAMNLLRAQLISDILTALSDIDISVIQIPLGSLVNSELVWARGPTLRARAMSVGTVDAEFESEFSSAGVNQTMHQIWMSLSVPIMVILPGGNVEVPVNTRLCVAETVIVGQVPDTYLQFSMPPASG